MAPPSAKVLVNHWDTIRYELLQTRLCDFALQIPGSPLEPFVLRLYREMAAKGLTFRPICYLTDGWGCPNEVPVIGVPFYLADKHLARIEEEQTGELEDDQTVMMLLRHEAGHAINYAYRLWEYAGWTETFGSFSKPYRDNFRPMPFSRQFVRHISHHRHGRTYAQKHPDEDFAETFAIWVAPRSNWRRRYRNWPALRKLKYVDQLMRRLRLEEPKLVDGPLLDPIEGMQYLLAEHYGKQSERYKAAAQGYVDDKLREVFPVTPGKVLLPAAALLRAHLADLANRVQRWSGLDPEEVASILAKLADRAEALALQYRKRDQGAKLLDVMALATSLAMDFVYTGRLANP